MRAIKILVADDEATVRLFIQTVIHKEQLPVAAFAEASNGAEAIRLAGEMRPDLIFLDIRMPGLDGLQAARTILAGDPDATIVIVSAYDEFEYARSAFRAGVSDYLLKPIKPDDVIGIITKTAQACGPEHEQGPAQPAKVPPLVKGVVDYVAANLDKPIRLGDIAKGVFVSPSHLSRTFKQLTGQSIVDYMQEQRLNKAAELLATTDLSVTEVAGRVGFNDATYFTTCFKNKTGLPPAQYKKQQDIKDSPHEI